jgi:hypothetical protein
MFKILIFVMLTAAFAAAQASRTWVSGVGDDVNPCSRTAPCKTFAGAISKTAAGGEIDALDPAGFGGVTITKAITLDGGSGQVASVLVTGTNGIVVQAGPTDVVILRNLKVNGISSGINGIRFLAGKALIVENCQIFGFANNGIDIASNSGAHVYVSGSSSNNNGFAGLSSQNTTATTAVIVNNSSFYDNSVFGVASKDFTVMTVSNSDASGNGSIGFLAQASAGTATLNLIRSTSAHNAIGVQSGGGSSSSFLRMAGLAIFENFSTGIVVGVNGVVTTFTGSNYNQGLGTPNASLAPQ